MMSASLEPADPRRDLIVDALVAERLGASLALCRRTDSETWRQELGIVVPTGSGS